jgi:hypothetical protein
MAVKAEEFVSDLFKQAVETFDATLKASVKIQEEAAKWWTYPPGQVRSVQEWQEKSRKILDEAIPTSQANAEEYLRLIEENTRTCLDLLRKSFEAIPVESVQDAQEKAQKLWEASLEAVRKNAQAILKTNAKAMKSWAEFARKAIETNGKGTTTASE